MADDLRTSRFWEDLQTINVFGGVTF
jgi:hypothetical protein